MIKYATIGRGVIVDCYIKGTALTKEFSLEAVYSRNSETGREYAEKWGCKKVYTDLESLAADPEIEAVYIASPNSCHGYQSEIMLNSGKHVICEKPITTSAKEYKRLKALADSKGLIYMEAIIPLYVDSRAEIKNAIGKIGKISMAKLDFGQLTSRYESLIKGEHVNIFDMSLHAGTLMDLGIYCVYAAVDLLGIPQGIKASASYLENGADGSGAAVFDYGSFTAALTYSKVGQSVTHSEITGDKGAVTVERIGLYSGARFWQNGEEIPLGEMQNKEQLMSCEAKAFAQFIKGENKELYAENSETCYNVHKCMDAIKKSADIKYP